MTRTGSTVVLCIIVNLLVVPVAARTLDLARVFERSIDSTLAGLVAERERSASSPPTTPAKSGRR